MALASSGPISMKNIRDEFYNNRTEGDGWQLDDYLGATYWNVDYPYALGRFSTTRSQIDMQHFQGKSATDPVVSGSIFDTTPGSNKIFKIPVFRTSIKFEAWGGGGGAGTGDHDADRGTGDAATSSNFVTPKGTLVAGGGGGGSSGYRYGNQNGAGGGGGTTSGNISGTGTSAVIQINGNAGGNGDSGGGSGSNGGSAPYGGAGGLRGAYNNPNGNGINGLPGSVAGGGGGSGGNSDFQSGKNANPNRSAGGAGGSGAYVSATLDKNAIVMGTNITYTVGSGGIGKKNGNQGTGGNGAAGGVRIIWS